MPQLLTEQEPADDQITGGPGPRGLVLAGITLLILLLTISAFSLGAYVAERGFLRPRPAVAPAPPTPPTPTSTPTPSGALSQPPKGAITPRWEIKPVNIYGLSGAQITLAGELVVEAAHCVQADTQQPKQSAGRISHDTDLGPRLIVPRDGHFFYR